MRRLSAIAVIVVFAGGCVIDQKPKVAAVAPPPKAPPLPPPAPQVFPQNVAQAPPSQPVPADAIPPRTAGGFAAATEPAAPLAHQLPVRVNPPGNPPGNSSHTEAQPLEVQTPPAEAPPAAPPPQRPP